VAACPQEVLGLSNERITAKGYHPAELAAAGCTGCGICAVVCPEAAIEVYREVLHRESTGRAPAGVRANQEDRNEWPAS
jgi:ferredoxin